MASDQMAERLDNTCTSCCLRALKIAAKSEAGVGCKDSKLVRLSHKGFCVVLISNGLLV